MYCPEKQIEGVVHVDDAALPVRRDRDAAAHVGHDQIRPVVGDALAVAVQPGDGLLVERVGDRLAHAHRHARKAGHVVHLVHDGRIGDVGLDAGHVGDLRGEQSAQVAGVAHAGVAQVVAHAGVDLVDARGYGADQTSPADDGREVPDLEPVLAQGVENQTATPVELVDDVGESGELFRRMTQGQFQQRPLLLVEGDLRGGRAGIYR